MDKRLQAIQIVTSIHRTFVRCVAMTQPRTPTWWERLRNKIPYAGDGARIEREYPNYRPYMEALVVPKNTPIDVQAAIRTEIEATTGLRPNDRATLIRANHLVVCFEVRDTRLDTIYGFSVFGTASPDR